MKVSPKDLTIFSDVQFCPDEAPQQTAERLGLREHVVRRAVARGRESGILKRRVYVNYFKLGLSQYSIFFSIPAKSVARKERIRKALLTAPFVELALEVGGRFDFGVVLTVGSPFDVEYFFDFLTKGNEIALSDIHLQVRTGWYYFGVKYLDPTAPLHAIDLVPSGGNTRLAVEEAELLSAYALSPDGNRSKIARALGVPLSTVQYRLEMLERSGVIAGVRYQILSDKFGYEAFRVLISCRVPLTTYRTAVLEWARRHPIVLTFMHGFGNWQYELRIETARTSAATGAVDDLRERFAEFIDHAEVVPVAKVLKMKLQPDASLLGL